MNITKKARQRFTFFALALFLFGIGGVLLPKSIVYGGLRLIWIPNRLLSGGVELVFWVSGVVVLIALVLGSIGEGDCKEDEPNT